jgi:hypothetical protein
MREFFRGWRRKAGCLLLLAACALLVLWFRTLRVEDVILSGDGKGTINSWHASRSGVFWNRYTGIVMKPGLRWELARGRG